MPEKLFTFLFKLRPVVFEKGRFGFEAAGPWVLAALALAIVLASAAMYLRQRSRTGGSTVVFLAVLRALIVALVVFALLRPVLRISTVVPGENFLAVLIDDSRSMQLADDETDSRGGQALGLFTAASGDAASSALRRRLEERFTLRYYRFSDAIARMDPAHPLTFRGNATDLGAALDYVRQDLHGVPLAGAVLVTDGADNADTRLTDPLLQLKSRAVPVYTVGLGEEHFAHDVEITRVEGPDRVLEGSAFTVDVMVAQQGYDGETMTLTVEESGAIVATRDVTFAAGQDGTTVRVHLEAETEGSRDYRFYIEPDERERVSENNARGMLVTVEDRREKILYFEGEPRWEVKFLRRAVAADENIHVVALLRSAENKYLRLGVDDPLELNSGFPATREELFAYRGLILGSVEASFFTHHQLLIIEEFVSQRGGGLLLLGGRKSFAEGGYAGTPLENVFPVVLEEPAAPDALDIAEVRVDPTPTGLAHAAVQLGPNLEASRQRWSTLPPLLTRNRLYRVKPGASLLLTGSPLGGGDDVVVLASQRYGRGRVVAFPVQDSWQWQMHADIELDDMTHERLWRQMLRWLVSTASDRVALDTSGNKFLRRGTMEGVAPGEPVTLRAEVNDAAYLGLNGARVHATITDPTGVEQTVPLEWTVEEDGEYQATFVPEQLGSYEVSVEAEYAGEVLGSDTARVVAVEPSTEYFGAEMNAPLLRRIAEETGGRFYTADTVDGLAEDARFTDSGKTVVETYELWDMPVVLLLLLALISAEWGLRRQRGLA